MSSVGFGKEGVWEGQGADGQGKFWRGFHWRGEPGVALRFMARPTGTGRQRPNLVRSAEAWPAEEWFQWEGLGKAGKALQVRLW